MLIKYSGKEGFSEHIDLAKLAYSETEPNKIYSG